MWVKSGSGECSEDNLATEFNVQLILSLANSALRSRHCSEVHEILQDVERPCKVCMQSR